MDGPAHSDWRALCGSRGIDPGEVEMVAGRYEAYRDYMASRGAALTLDAWFRFYALEKAAESGSHGGGLAGGCSADGEPIKQDLLSNPAAFLEILQSRLALGKAR